MCMTFIIKNVIRFVRVLKLLVHLIVRAQQSYELLFFYYFSVHEHLDMNVRARSSESLVGFYSKISIVEVGL